MIELIRQEKYDRGEITEKLEKVFQDNNLIETFLSGKKSVLLKPNFVVPEIPAGGSTTHPDFYMSAALFLKRNGFKVGIGESPAFGSCRKGLQFHGVLDECLKEGIDIVEFKGNEQYPGVEESPFYKSLTITAELKKWDAVINLPKIKVHQQFMFTGATKNLYGCVTGKRKFIRHNLCKNDPVKFAQMVIANAEKAGCVLHIGDGIEAMHIKGPRGGERFPLGKIVVSDEFLVHDWLVCHLIGLDPLITPLFNAVKPGEIESISASCQSIIESPDFEVAQNFIQSYYTDISFNPWHLVRSQWRSLKFKLKRA